MSRRDDMTKKQPSQKEETELTKFWTVLASRRFWATLASVGAALQCYRLGLLSGPELAEWLRSTAGVYVGAVAAEHVATLVAALAPPAPPPAPKS